MKAFAPTGSPIIGTREMVYGTAAIALDSFERHPLGLKFEYAGDTEIDWDTQQTVNEDNYFVDQNGEYWTEDQLTFEEPASEAAPTDGCTHEWAYTGTAYGGDDSSYLGEGRCYCIHCGADGDA